jgi:uncharacterized protein
MSMRIAVHVQPKAKNRDVSLRDDGSLRMRVTVAAEGGKANEAVCDLVAETMGVAKRDVSLVSGHRNRSKVLEIALETDAVAIVLAALPRVK